MAGSSVKKKRAHKRSIILVVLVTLLFAAVFSVLILRLRKSNAILNQNVAELEESVAAEEARKEELSQQENGKLTLREIIEIARERFGLVFPNEIIFVPEEEP